MTGLQYALCALSFFRHRHDRRPRFKRPKRSWNIRQTTSQASEYRSIARDFIGQARAAGFRGSVIQQVMAAQGKDEIRNR